MFEPRERDAVAEKVAKYSQARVLSGDGDYWQLAVERDGRVIGDVYFTIKSAEHQTGEIGWTLHPDFSGQGFMTEAAGAVLGLAFAEIGLHRVMAELDARNTSSIALCRRLGHARGGPLRRGPVVQGRVGRHGDLRDPRARVAYRSRTRSSCGREQQMSALPSAGGSIGSGS